MLNEEPGISDIAYDLLREDGRFVDEKGKDSILGLADPPDDYGDIQPRNKGLYSVSDMGAKPPANSNGKNADDLLKPLPAAPTSYSYFVWNEDIIKTMENPPVERREV